MAGTRTLKVSILADIDDLNRKLKSGSDDVETFGDKLGKWSKLAAGAFVAAGAAAAAYAGKLAIDGVKSALEDEKAQAKLAATLQNVTGATDDAIAATEDYITQTALATGITDDELRPSLDRLVRSTKDVTKAQELQKIALDVSAGTGKSLQAVTEALGKAYDGNLTSLGKLGLGIDKAKLSTMSFDQVTAQLSKTFGGQAAQQAATFQGQMDRLKVAFDEAKETVGTFILKALTPMLDWFNAKIFPALASFGDKLGDMGLSGKFKTVANIYKNVFEPILDGLRDLFGKITDAVQRNTDKFQPLIDILKKVAEFIYETVAPAFGTVLGGTLSKLGDVLGWIIDKIATAVNFVARGIQTAVNAAISGINALIRAYNAIPFLDNAQLLAPVNFGSTPGTTISAPSTTPAPKVTIPSISGVTGGGGTKTGGGGSGTAAAAAKQTQADKDRETLMEVTKLQLDATQKSLTTLLSQIAATKAEYNITVNGAIDAEGTARTIENVLRTSAARTGDYLTLGRAPLGVSAVAL